MCFTPIVSLTTAIIEFIVVIYLFKKIKDPRLRPLPYFIFFLGVYQLTEFLLCTTGNSIWAKIGFIAYTLLPVLLMHLFYNLSRNKLNKLFYSIPLAYSVIALIHPEFIISTTCESFFISTKNLFFWNNRPLTWVYLLYYGLFPIMGVFKLINQRRKIKNKSGWKLRTAFLLGPGALILAQAILIFLMTKESNYSQNWIITSIGLLLISIIILILGFLHIKTKLFNRILFTILCSSVIITYVLYQIFPGFGLRFASIYCHFALLYTLAAILLVESIQSK